MRRLALLAFAPLALAGMGAMATTPAASEPPPKAPPPGTYVLPVIGRAPPGRVLDLDAHDVPLARFTSGKITLLSFMYTYCADPVGCPMVYRTFDGLRVRLLATPELARQVRLVSLSFDPSHDTPDTMRRYAGNLAAEASPLRWHFLTTASLARLQPIVDGLGQSVQLQARTDGQPGRFFNHMVKVYLIDARGRVREIYSSAFLQPDFIYHDILTLIMEGQGGLAPAATLKARAR